MQRNVFTYAAAAALSILSIPCALADFKDLIDRIPGEANALVVIDVDKLLNNPLAIREGWKRMRDNTYADRPLIVPPNAGTVRSARPAFGSSTASAICVSRAAQTSL